jgi:hypothetical protein
VRKIRPCDLCGDKASQVTLRADYDTPLMVITRSFRRLEDEPGHPFCFELVDRNDAPFPGVPVLCERCFLAECNRVFARNRQATVGDFGASLRRRN